MKGKCALSESIADLQLSHIYLKFAIKYIRQTSNNGLLRSYKDINIACQDGLKEYLLSKELREAF